MKKIILVLTILASIAAVSCNSKQAPTIGEKPLTSNVPSDDKTKKEGTPLSQWNGSTSSLVINASVAANNNTGNTQTPAEGYTLLERLYNTTWYQSEKEMDDGRLETDEEFVFFNENSYMVKREYENGRIDGRDEYSKLKHIEDVSIPNAAANKDRNACIVQNTERDDYELETEYEGYYLVDRDTLYIVDGDTQKEVKDKLNAIISGNTQRYSDDKFVLSTKAL